MLLFRYSRLFQIKPATVNAVFHSDHSLSSRLVHRTNDKQGRTSIPPLCSALMAARLFPRLVASECSVAMEICEREIIMGLRFVMYFLEEITKLIMCCLNAKQKKQTQQSEVSLRYIKKHFMRDRTTTIAELIAVSFLRGGWFLFFFFLIHLHSFSSGISHCPKTCICSDI